MNRSTAIFLVCLRLTIGWHFLVEGWHKVHSQLVGPAETNRVFSSAGYFREAPGPLARLLRSQGGDPDDELLARLTVQPLPKDVDPAKYPAQNRIPPALSRDWDDYLARFLKHYTLDDVQKNLAKAKLEQMKHNVVVWLTLGEKEIKKPFPGGEVERKETTEQRIAEYRAKVREVRDTYENRLPLMGKDVEKARLAAAKAEVARLRGELAADLNEQTNELKKILRDLLPKSVTEKEKDDPLAEETGKSMLDYLDRGVAWGLLAIGAGLLLGLFTRLWCVLGVGFLFLTYLAAPPMPWWPAPPQQEGTYLFVNKNVVEMLALMVLATTHSGRWFGLDALIHGVLTGFRDEKTIAN